MYLPLALLDNFLINSRLDKIMFLRRQCFKHLDGHLHTCKCCQRFEQRYDMLVERMSLLEQATSEFLKPKKKLTTSPS